MRDEGRGWNKGVPLTGCDGGGGDDRWEEGWDDGVG